MRHVILGIALVHFPISLALTLALDLPVLGLAVAVIGMSWLAVEASWKGG